MTPHNGDKSRSLLSDLPSCDSPSKSPITKETENILKAKPINDKGTNKPFKMSRSEHNWFIDPKNGKMKKIVDE